MGTAGNLHLYRLPTGCGCLSCDLCLAEEGAVMVELEALLRAQAKAQRERIIAAEERRFLEELAVY